MQGRYIVKKVLFAIPTLEGGGAEKVLVNLCNSLSEKNYNVTVLMLFNKGVNRDNLSKQIKTIAYFKVNIHGARFILKCFSPENLAKKLKAENYDLIVSYLEGTMTRIISGCPDSSKKIAWVHSKLTETNLCEHFRSVQEATECYSRYDSIVCVSEEVRQNFLELLPEIQHEKVSVLHNVNESDDIIKLADEKTDAEFDTSHVNAVIVGKIVSSKGIYRIPKAFELFPNELKKLNVYFVGSGSESEKFQQNINEKKLADNIKLTGYQSNPYKWIKKADILICPSYTEGLSTVVTEALILGTPVITTDCGGMKELLGNSEYGRIVENDDAALAKGLAHITLNEDERMKYRELALQRGKIFMKETILAQTISLFNSVAGNEMEK